MNAVTIYVPTAAFVVGLVDSGFNYFDEWEEPEKADEDAAIEEDEHREAEPTTESEARVETRVDALWYVVPDQAPRPWEHGRRVTNPMALSGVPGGPVIVAEAGPLDGAHGESNPYATAIVRFQADGSRHSLIASEPDVGSSSGFKLMMLCPTPNQPAPWWIANLTIGREGQVAFTSLPDRLILWNP